MGNVQSEGRRSMNTETDEIMTKEEDAGMETEVTVDFDDSSIEDRSKEFERDCRMLELGVMGKEEFRKRWRE